MTRPDHIDPDEARAARCTDAMLHIIEMRNDGASWREIAAATGRSRANVRRSHQTATNRIRRWRDHEPSHTRRERVQPTPDVVRGWPATGRNVAGVIAGTNPGDPARSAIRDSCLS